MCVRTILVDLCACARPHAGMQKPLSNPFRPASSRNSKPSCEADEFERSAVSEMNFHHAIPWSTLERSNLETHLISLAINRFSISLVPFSTDSY